MISAEMLLLEIENGVDAHKICEEKFNCDLESFEKIANYLVNFTFPIKSPLTGKLYQGFVFPEENMFIDKQEYKK